MGAIIGDIVGSRFEWHNYRHKDFTLFHPKCRPTDDSIMRHNAGGFNAPSREAIFKRIMKLSEPSGWKYDFEAFVAYDEINRSAASQAYYENQMENFDEESFVPLAPPVVREE